VTLFECNVECQKHLPNAMPFGIIDGMDLKIDSAGRLILPKRVRDRLRLTTGSVVELEEHPGEVVLRPKEQAPAFVQRNGRWVYVGQVHDGFDWDAMVEKDREERDREILGL
jgi:AbrB family looped-hinge helix DNA binding protein